MAAIWPSHGKALGSRSHTVLGQKTRSKPCPLTEAMVAAVEQELGYTLPASDLRLLREKNGGAPKRQCHPTGGQSWSDNQVRVISIFGIGGRWGIDAEEFGTKDRIQEAGYPEIGILVGWTPTSLLAEPQRPGRMPSCSTTPNAEIRASLG